MKDKISKEELRLELIVCTFRDKLIELDEKKFINWVEKKCFPMSVVKEMIKENKKGMNK
tara:strand:+ start:457 stop:633 length:177 start_codon:yes stop_codon:yes gene_type:complete